MHQSQLPAVVQNSNNFELQLWINIGIKKNFNSIFFNQVKQ